MSKKKRVTLQPKDKEQEQEAKVYPGKYKKRGVTYPCFFVRGWKKDGKWQRKQFTDEGKAKDYAASINLNLRSHGKKQQQLLLTTLTEEQLKEAEELCRILGNTYTLTQAGEFFLKHHRAPDFTIDLLDGLEIYLDVKEHEGVRVSTRKKIKSVLRAFANYTDNPDVHTVTEESVNKYLKSLRGEDGVSKAKRKTWNNHRNELASFFKWACERDLSTNRPWTFHNPAESALRYSNERIAEERPPIAVTDPETVRELLTYAMNYKGGKMVKVFALAYFAGVRPDLEVGEMSKLHKDPSLINLTDGRIAVTAEVAKTKSERPVAIMPNLKAWLEAYQDMPLIPPNARNDYGHIRQKFGLQKDETRHSFISYHVALYRSLAEAALQAGNSESMIKKHYLTFPTLDEGIDYFSILPDMAKGEAVMSEEKLDFTKPQHLRVI